MSTRQYFVFLTTVFISSVVSFVVLAQAGQPEVAQAVSSNANAFAFGAAIIMAAATGMGTLSQSRAAVAALEGIARNPQAAEKVQMPFILSLALIESLVIFSLLIAYMLVKKI